MNLDFKLCVIKLCFVLCSVAGGFHSRHMVGVSHFCSDGTFYGLFLYFDLKSSALVNSS